MTVWLAASVLVAVSAAQTGRVAATSRAQWSRFNPVAPAFELAQHHH
ncbi:MAG TPA: hypothetical protein VMH28_11660 [Candidatus Acidoferrales bacterium]|nr:hypothetical protein [Candidatus Acidoferrales bacterium]